ncbi:MAG: hypothetical protein ACRCXC_08610 [Legionella sp.]
MPPKDKQGPNGFCDHFLNYAWFAETTFTYIDPEQDNAKRNARNFWLYSLGRSLIYYGFLFPYTYFVRPTLTLLLENWGVTACIMGVLVAAGLTFAGILPGLAFFGITSLLFPAGFVAATSPLDEESNFKTSAEHAEILKEYDFAELHDPSLPRNPTMDIYSKDNAEVIDLTYGQIKTYYHAMRRILNKKDALPAEEQESEHVQGMT